jgi:glycosyltransferase involved in cell wall biosynthesis
MSSDTERSGSMRAPERTGDRSSRAGAPGARATSAATLDLGGARVGVVIPAYRVAAQIESVIRDNPAWVHAILVVDDKSPDDTAERVTRLADPRVTLIRHDVNKGVGGAMQSGFAEALRQGLDVVVKMDGDGQMDAEYLPALVQPLVDGRADMVKCNSYWSRASLQQMPVVRLIGNAGLGFLVKMASGYWNVFDPANGYIAVRGQLLERVDLARLPNRFFFESGFLIELGIQRAVVLDVPMTARYADEHSSLSPLRILFEFPPRLLAGAMRRLFWRYFVHDFSAVSVFVLLGLPLLLCGLTYGTFQYVTLAREDQYASAGVVMLAAMPIILGAQMLLQALVLDVGGVPRQPLCPPIRSVGTASPVGSASAVR